MLGGIYGQDAVEKFVAETSLSNIFGYGDGIFDPVGDKIADLQEQFPDVPLEAVAAVTMTAIEEHTSKYNSWGQPSQEVQADWIFDPELPESNEALQEILENMQAYYSYYGTDLPPPPTVEPDTGGSGGSGGNNNNDDNDDGGSTTIDPTTVIIDPADPVIAPPTRPWKPDEIDVTVPETSEWDDGFGGATIPIILDLDGDGIEVAFGEDIYFDLDDDGFLEQTSWAAADDGFLVIDLNADGTRGAGDGVIDQSNELVLSSLGLEGDTDLQALARYDLGDADPNDIKGSDGKLDANDAIWNELKVWQDQNQDGKTEGDATELKTLAAWGIFSINLAYDDGTDFTDESNDVEVFGNILHGLAVAA